jgi:hypothetical protein
METEENTRWLNDKIQFARLLCEINAALDSLDCELIASVTTSMDLEPIRPGSVPRSFSKSLK